MMSNYVRSPDGARIAYEISGQGPAILLAHGMGYNRNIWEETGWVDKLAAHFTVITMDIRGFGESDKSHDSAFYSIGNIINDIHAIIHTCGFEEYHYFGHSYGATIGLQACMSSKHVQKVVCAGTTFGDDFFKESVPIWVKEHERLHALKLNKTYHEQNLTEEDIEWIESTDLESRIALLKALESWHGVNVRDITKKLAVYSGSEDNPFILENFRKNERELSEIGIPFKIFENINHIDLVSKIEIVSPWVLDFLIFNRSRE